MKETIIKYTCDACGLEISKPTATVTVEVAKELIRMPFGYDTFDICSHELDGTYDLCTDCLHKVVKCLNLV